MEDSISPRLNIEDKSLLIDVSGGSAKAPVVVVVKINQVKEHDDLGRGDEWALKIDARRGGVVSEAYVFTSEELQIARRKGEYMRDTALELAVVPGCNVAVSMGPCNVLQCRLDTDVGIVANI